MNATKQKFLTLHPHEVRGIIAGTVSVIRRVVTPQPLTKDPRWFNYTGPVPCAAKDGDPEMMDVIWGGPCCPVGEVGDVVFPQVGFNITYNADLNLTYWSIEGRFITTHGRALAKTGTPIRDGNRAAREMPYWLSQELKMPELEFCEIRVQRLGDVTEEDCIAEGIRFEHGSYELEWCTPNERTRKRMEAYRERWNVTHKRPDQKWRDDLWTWRMSIRRT